MDKIISVIKKKHKELTNIKPFFIKQHLWIFCNSLIENPSFDSQTKETLTTKISNFGSECLFTDKFLNSIIKSPILESIVALAKAKDKIKLSKALSSKKTTKFLGIKKLDDANMAGSNNSHLCTLILTEGDSAKSLAMAGIEIVGRDYYGVFPLKGKLLNVRDVSDSTIIANEEIQNIIRIIGLRQNVDYSENIKSLRYGSLMVMADQDYDGSHIKGLIINFIHYYWPSLIKRNDFLKEFITPIVKATRGDKIHSFYTINEFKVFWETIKENSSVWNIKYYKGLGTSTNLEAKDYFKNIKLHKISFNYINNEDDNAISLAFSKDQAEQRKNWLRNFNPLTTTINHNKGIIRFKDFIDQELIFFSNSDNIRSIPSILDGLKPSERKIIFSCFKRKLKLEIKVAQLAGYVSEHSAYHHGEISLSNTIVALAQDYVGANNINMLLPIGQFGNRYTGPKGAASSRYIFTSLNKLTRMLFREEDDPLLIYIIEEGLKIEPVS